ncbi:unnamed protein product [Blepharisma stoltei]|uniref:AAA+ ATPase domain-containing protein n=1 Tax=Blepharisma stoltei TaxID=1481888 RepID=A0AAU9JZ05_9CILI|nr:unnamed protein product [Blepharisma stoltei]
MEADSETKESAVDIKNNVEGEFSSGVLSGVLSAGRMVFNSAKKISSVISNVYYNEKGMSDEQIPFEFLDIHSQDVKNSEKIIKFNKETLNGYKYVFVLYNLPDKWLADFKLVASFVSRERKMQRFALEYINNDKKLFSTNDKLRLFILKHQNLDSEFTLKFIKTGSIKNLVLPDERHRHFDQSSYQFVFNLDISNKNKKNKPSGRPRSSNLYMLFYFSVYLFSETDWEKTVPTLLDCYKRDCELNHLDQDEHIEETIRFLFFILEKVLMCSSSLELKLEIVLGYFSCLPTDIFLKFDFFGKEILFSMVTPAIHQNLRPKIDCGIASLVALAFKSRSAKWIEFCQFIEDSNEFLKLIKLFDKNKIKLQDDEYDVFANRILNFSPDYRLWLELELNILVLSPSIYLKKAYLFMKKYKEIEENIIIASINKYFGANKIKLKEISEIFSTLHILECPKFNLLILASNLKIIIQRYFKYFKYSKDKIKYLKDIFNKKSNEPLCGLSPYQLCHNIISDSLELVSFSELFRNFELSQGDWQILFDLWLNNYEFKKIENICELILDIDEFFCLIKDSSQKLLLSIKFGDKLQWEKERNTELVNLARYFDNCKEKLIKIKYISFVCNNIINNLAKDDLDKFTKDIMNSEIFKIFQKYLEFSLDTDIEEKILAGIISDHALLKLITYKEYLQNTAEFCKLSQIISNLWSLINENKIKINSLGKISHQNDMQRYHFLWLINQFQDQTEANFEIILNDRLCKYNEIAETVVWMDKLIDFLCKDKNLQEISLMKKEYEKYTEKSLPEFSFSLKSKPLRVLAMKTKNIIDSKLYNNEYLNLISSRGIINSSSILSIANEALENVKESLRSIIDASPNLLIKGKDVAYLLREDSHRISEILLFLFDKKEHDKIEQLMLSLDLLKLREKIMEKSDLLKKLEIIIIAEENTFLSYLDLPTSIYNHESLSDLLEKKEEIRNLNEKLTMGIDDSKVFSVIKEMVESPDLWNLIREIERGVINQLKIKYDLFGKDFNSIQIVLDLETAWNLFTNIYKLSSIDSPDKYVLLFQAIQNSIEETKLIDEVISHCRINLNFLRKLKESLYESENTKIKQISSILAKSTLQFNFVENEFHMILFSSSDKFNQRSLVDVKDWAVLFNRKVDEENQYSKFACLIEDCMKILFYLNSLYGLGFLKEIIPPEVEIEEEKVFCREGENSGIICVEDYQNMLKDRYSEWLNTLEQCYKNSYLLTFLKGRDFWIFKNFFNSGKISHKLMHLMGFMNIKVKEYCEIQGSPNKQLQNLSKILESYNEKPTKANKFQRYFPFIVCSKTLYGIIKIFKNSVPSASQILFCHEFTEWKDIISFVYRSVTDPNKRLHILVHCENLRTGVQNAFLILFDKLLNDSQLKFKFGAISLDDNSSIGAYFKNSSKTNIIDCDIKQDEVENTIKKSNIKKAFVYCSKRAGIGKTTAIRNIAKHFNKKFVTFNIAGNVNIVKLCKRLSEIKMPSESDLYFQISHISNPEIANEILINICLFRVLNYSDYLIVFPDKIDIYIEVASTHNGWLYESIDYLKYCETKTVSLRIEHLDVESNIPKCERLVHNLVRYAWNNWYQVDLREKDFNRTAIRWLWQNYDNLLSNENLPLIQLKVFFTLLSTLINNFDKGFEKILPLGQKERRSIFSMNSEKPIEINELKKEVFRGYLETAKDLAFSSANIIERKQSKEWNILHKKTKLDYQDQEEIGSQHILNWQSYHQSLIIFNEEGNYAILSKNTAQESDTVWKLQYALSNQNEKASNVIKGFKEGLYSKENYSKLLSSELLAKLKQFFRNENSSVYYKNYVLTPDNYLKMHLIYLKAAAKIPIIIIGDTGCGKSALIKFLVTEILVNQNFKKIDIHNGTTIEMIKQSIEEVEHEAADTPAWDTWVLFDEFNTTENVGIICDIMCSRKFEGKNLPKNINFIGTCNPYRVSRKKIENIGIKSKRVDPENLKLVHHVKPLPMTMLKYAWDFGSLTKEDFKQYTLSMLEVSYQETVFTQFIWKLICLLKLKIPKNPFLYKNAIKQYQNMLEWKYDLLCGSKNLLVEMICKAHEYLPKTEDESISLRDVARFIKIKSWFSKSIEEKRKYLKNTRYLANETNYNLKIKDFEIDEELRAGILSFCVCYYLRIFSKKSRKAFLEHIVDQLNRDKNLKIEYPRLDQFLTTDVILSILESEQDDLIARMELTKGIAINKPLKENIFCMIVCILNQIPLLICGKPGSSKSLSIELVFANLKGVQSYDPYFKTLPVLTEVPFQGSDSCKSEEINEIFSQANNYLDSSREKGATDIPVIVFDEIGLAEISKYNPLKVLHNLLEIENIHIGFVGISNWKLDASKMNRALFLAREDPGVDDLCDTANSIYSFYSNEKPYQKIIEDLSYWYYKLKEHFKPMHCNNEFYGLRDFYHLIKRVSKELTNPIGDYEKVFEIVKLSVERNFGGLKNEDNHIEALSNPWNGYLWESSKRYSTIDLINDNLNEHIKGSSNGIIPRYLMIVGNSRFGICAIERILNSRLPLRKVMIGSCLKNDINNEKSAFQSLTDIILYMSTGRTVILKGMDQIYTALYDLFNQHFQWSGPSRYCKVALSSTNNSYCFVHPNFYTIVFLDEEEAKESDPPFLNRFEKHYLDINSLLSNKNSIEILKDLTNWVKIFKKQKGNRAELLKINNLFPIYSAETLSLMIYSSRYENQEEILKDCKLQLLNSASSIVMILSHQLINDTEEKVFIIDNWMKLHSAENSFISTLNLMVNDNCDKKKLLAFTFDNAQIWSTLNDTDPDLLACTSINKFHDYSAEAELCKSIENYFKEPNKKLYILEIDFSSENQHILMVKHIIDGIEEKYRKVKNFVIMGRMISNLEYREFIFYFEDWQMKMFEEIKRTSEFDISALLLKDTKKLIEENEIFEFETNICDLTINCMLKFKYNDENIDEHIGTVIEKVRESQDFIKLLKTKVYNQLENLKDWKSEILSENEIVKDFKNLKAYMQGFLSNEIEKELASILHHLENKGSLKSFLNLSGKKEKADFSYWLNAFENSNFEKIAVSSYQNNTEVEKTPNLSFLFSVDEYKLISKLYKQYGEIGQQSKKKLQMSIFQREFEKNSAYKKRLCAINEDSDAQEFYFSDLIKIYLFKNKIDQEYEKIILAMTENLRISNSHFCEKLIAYKRFEAAFIYISNIVKYSRININITLPSSIPENPLNNLIEHAISKTIDRVLTKPNGKKRAILGRILDNLISLNACCPSIVFENQELLEFWHAFLAMVNNTNFQGQITDIKNKIQNNCTYVFNPEFIKAALDYSELIFQNNPKENDVEVFKFRAAFYKILICKDHSAISQIIKEINSTGLWRHSTKLLREMYEKSNIKSKIANLNKMIDENEVNLVQERNEYLKEIEKNTTYGSKFSVLFADLIYKISDKIQIDEEEYAMNKLHYYRTILKTWKKRFLFYIEKLNCNEPIYTVIYSVQIRIFLESYSYLLLKGNGSLTEPEKAIMSETGTILVQAPISKTLRFYCIKQMKQISKWDKDGVYHYLESHKHIEWINRIEDIPAPSNSLEIFPFYTECIDYYKDITNIINKILINSDCQDLNSIIQEGLNNPNVKLAIAQAFLNEVFMHHPLEISATNNLNQWLERNESLITENLGEVFFSLLKMLLNNSFPQDSLFQFNVIRNKNNDQKLLILLTIFIITVSFGNCQNPISGVFFNDKRKILYNDISIQLNQMFVFAAELSPSYNYNKEKLDNWSNFISPSHSWWLKGSTYKCSENCSYIYTIPGDGYPRHYFKCGKCNKMCGGENKKLFKRDGHKNISHKEARKIMINAAYEEKLEEDNMRGCRFFSRKNKTLYIRYCKEITARVLHLILGTSIYGFKCLNLANLEKIFDSNGLNPEIYLKESIENDFKMILELLQAEDSHIWMYNILSKLPQFLYENNYLPFNSDIRKTFEELFEIQIIQPNIDHRKSSSIADYQRNFRFLFNEKVSDLDIIDEKVVTDLPLEKLFRVINKPTFCKMEQNFRLNDLAKEYPIINEYLQSFSEIQKLEALYPIIEFTNYLLDKYNYCYTRDECTKMRISDIIDAISDENEKNHFIDLFESFTSAWKSVNLCSVSNEENIEKNQISSSSYLNFFLIDQASNQGKLLKFALTELAGIQNKILAQICGSIRGSKYMVYIDKAKFGIQEIKLKNILEIKSLKRRYCYFCSLNNPSFGKGCETIYDYERISANLSADLGSVKYLDTSVVRCIQYQNEILKSDIIEEIEKRIPQNYKFEENDNDAVRSYKKKVDKTQDGNESCDKLKNCLRHLINLICILRNSTKTPDLSIKDYCSNLNLKHFAAFFKDEGISDIKLSHIVKLYQKIESYYFPWHIEKYMKIEYKLESFTRGATSRSNRERIMEQMKLTIENFKNTSKPHCDCRNLKTFIKRFIMRCLPAGIDPKDPISLYVTRTDLWKSSYKIEELEILKVRFSNEIYASFSLLFYEVVQQELSNQRMSDEGISFEINEDIDEGEESEEESEESEEDEESDYDSPRY